MKTQSGLLQGCPASGGVSVVLLACALAQAGVFAWADTVSLIPTNAVWKYLDTGVDLGSAWRAAAFDDSAWASGPAQLGLGDWNRDEATLVNSNTPGGRLMSAYFRHGFVVAGPSSVSNLTASLLYDAGAVAYVNGVEAFRVGMPPGPVNYTMLATAAVSDNALYTATLGPNLLVSGTNVGAVEVHQVTGLSTDLSFEFALAAQTTVPSSPLLAGPAALDPSFDAGEGVDPTYGFAVVASLAQQPDGKILLGGDFTRVHGEVRILLARLNADGSMDTSFDPGDAVGPGADYTVWSIALQSDSRVLVGGDLAGPGNIKRLHADGRLDNSFDYRAYPSVAYVKAIVVQPDQKIIVGGNGGLTRLEPSGAVDPAFQQTPETVGSIAAIALGPEGQIMVGGDFLSVDKTPRSRIARLNADGSLDCYFAPAPGLNARATALVWQPDGMALAAGEFTAANGVAMPGVARFRSDGTLDPAFHPGTTFEGVSALALQPDGKLLVGHARGITRLHPDGSLDTSFGTGPVLDPETGGGDVYQPGVHALLVQPDGKIVLSGGFQRVNAEPRRCIARLMGGALPPALSVQPLSQRAYAGQSAVFSVEATGTPPLHFQWQFNTSPIDAATNSTLHLSNLEVTNNGFYWVIITNVAGAVTSLAAQLEVFEPPTQPGQFDPLFRLRLSHRGYVEALAQQPDGRFYVAGFFDHIDGVDRSSLARLWPNGDVDVSFAAPPCLIVNAVAVQPDGRVLANLGFSGVPSRLARLHSDGRLDPSFVPYTNAATSVVAIQPDGRVLVASRYPVQRLVRLNADGSLDSSFNVAVDGVMVDHAIRVVTPLPTGQLLIGGGFNTVNGIARDGVARLNNDGTVDPTFDPVTNPDAWVNCLTVLPNEKILIAGGFGWQNGLPRRAIARLNPNGSLDPTFDPGAGIGSGDVEIHSIAVQADGRVLIGGNFYQVNGVPRNGLARLNADGRLDPSFLNPALSTSDDTRISAIVIQSADRALVAGDDPTYAIGLLRVYLGPTLRPFVTRQLPYQGGPTVRLVCQPSSSIAAYAVEDQPPAGWLINNLSHGGVLDRVSGKVKFGPFFDADHRLLTYDALPPAWGVHGLLGVFSFTGEASADGLNSVITGDQYLTVAGLFPADLTPADSQMGLAELTAYGAAWRRGERWPVNPNPIPIDYVTRAAALWRGGEYYTVDRGVTIEPLWWANYDPGVLYDWAGRTRLPALGGAATRRLPLTFVPAEPFIVTIAALPAAGVSAYALEEQVPLGWTVTNISSGGELDAVSGKVKWGPFPDDVARSLSFQTMAPPDARAGSSFTGLASFDGASILVAGTRQSRPSCRLAVKYPTQDGILRLCLTGLVGATFEIQASSDLLSWTPFMTVTNVQGSVHISEPEATRQQQRFYRTRLIE